MDETDENGPLLGDKIHSANGTDCGHEEEECTQSVDKEKEKINQGIKAKHKNKLNVVFNKLK